MEWSILSDLDFGHRRQRSPSPTPKPRLPDVLRPQQLPRKLSESQRSDIFEKHDRAKKRKEGKKGRQGSEDSKSPPRSLSREGAADQIILVPSGAAQKRLKLRKAMRSRLANCHSIESLQEASNQALSVMRKAGGQAQGLTPHRPGAVQSTG